MNIINRFEDENWFLSNFYPSKVEYNGHTFATSEHAYQAAKATNEFDVKMIQEAANPAKAKKIGKRIPLKENWEEIKLDIMRDILKAKFSNRELAEKLLATENAELVEGNWWHDNFFGSCTCAKCGNYGKNNLGKLLMELREKIRRERQ